MSEVDSLAEARGFRDAAQALAKEAHRRMGTSTGTGAAYEAGRRDAAIALAAVEPGPPMTLRVHEVYEGLSGQQRVALVDDNGRIYHCDLEPGEPLASQSPNPDKRGRTTGVAAPVDTTKRGS